MSFHLLWGDSRLCHLCPTSLRHVLLLQLCSLLEFLSIPYEVGFEIHGDVQTCWRSNYQPKLGKSKFDDRRQSLDADLAAKAQRLFAMWLHEDQPKPSIKQQLQAVLASLAD